MRKKARFTNEYENLRRKRENKIYFSESKSQINLLELIKTNINLLTKCASTQSSFRKNESQKKKVKRRINIKSVIETARMRAKVK